MRCAWTLILCAAAVSSWQQVGWAQEQAAEQQTADEPPPVQIDRLSRQLAELKKQRSGLIEKLAAEYRARPESVQILQERDQARTALKAATEQALASVREDPQYRKELAKKQEMESKLQAMRAAGRADPTQIAQMATACHLAKLKLAQLESDATSGNPELIDARARLASAEAAVTRLQAEADAYAIASDEYAQLVQVAVETRTDINAIEAATRVPELPTQANAPSLELIMLRSWDESQRFFAQPPMRHTITYGEAKPGLPVTDLPRKKR